MDFDRRSFVKFLVGAVAGLHAGPLVPKLMDDVAIWTQNWWWVPRPENGAVAYANAVNPATGTGVRAKIIDGRMNGQRLIRVEGNPEYPLTGGGLSPDDASALQYLYNDEVRVNTPLARDPKSGVYSKIGWDKALKIISDALKDLAGAGKAHTVAALCQDPGYTGPQLMAMFMAAYGSPNMVSFPTSADTLAMVGGKMFGSGDLGFDFANTNYVVSFGSPLLEKFGAPVAAKAAFAQMRARGAKLAQIDCITTVTGSQADTFIGVPPGYEGAVALAMAHVLIGEGVYDRAVETAPGFAQYKALAADYAPDKLAKMCGADAALIVKTAKEFAAAAPKCVAIVGGCTTGDPGSLADFASVMGLNALVRNIGKKGGVVARAALPLKPLGAMANPAQKPLAGPLDPAALAENGLKGNPYKINVLFTVGGNPAFSGPQAETMKKFMASVPLTVAITPFKDETAANADIILPMGTFLESWGDCVSSYGAAQASYGLHKPLVSASPDAVSLGDIVIRIAKAVGGPAAAAMPADSMEKILAARTAPAGKFEKLAQAGFWAQPAPAYGAIGLKSFVSAKPSLPQTYKAYPMVMAPIYSARTQAGGQPITPYMMKILDVDTLANKTKLVVEMNPATAKKLSLTEGEMIEIKSPAGAIKAKLHLFNGAAPGAVFVPLGLGHTAFADYLKGKGDNFHAAAEVSKDPESGLPRWRLSRVTISKVRG